MKRKMFWIIAVVFITSCATAYHYNYSLLSVERPPAASEKYGPAKIEQVADSLVARYRFGDSLIEVVLSINTEQFELVCKNKTDRPIKIDWEKAAFINTYGIRKRVFHGGVRYERKDEAQKPSIIRQGETLSDHVLPSENVNVYLYGSGGFTVYPLFSTREYGKTARLLLPIEVDGAVNEYCFQFKIGLAQ
jgi:hypothetical protein